MRDFEENDKPVEPIIIVDPESIEEGLKDVQVGDIVGTNSTRRIITSLEDGKWTYVVLGNERAPRLSSSVDFADQNNNREFKGTITYIKKVSGAVDVQDVLSEKTKEERSAALALVDSIDSFRGHVNTFYKNGLLRKNGKLDSPEKITSKLDDFAWCLKKGVHPDCACRYISDTEGFRDHMKSLVENGSIQVEQSGPGFFGSAEDKEKLLVIGFLPGTVITDKNGLKYTIESVNEEGEVVINDRDLVTRTFDKEQFKAYVRNEALSLEEPKERERKTHKCIRLLMNKILVILIHEIFSLEQFLRLKKVEL